MTAGQVLVDGVNVKEYTEEALHDKMGFIPQKPVMFDGTIRSNLAFGTNAHGELTDEDLMKAARIAQAEANSLRKILMVLTPKFLRVVLTCQVVKNNGSGCSCHCPQA